MADLILASASPYRRELLARLGLPFRCIPAHLDEQRLPGEAPETMVARLARGKAEAAAQPNGLVIGSDQIAVLGDRVLGKPGNHERAKQQLTALRGQAVLFLTAVALLDTTKDTWLEHVDKTWVTFRALSDAEIDGYLTQEEPYDCAGAFKAEGLGISLFETIDSLDPTALIGLPLIWLSQALCQVELNPLTQSRRL